MTEHPAGSWREPTVEGLDLREVQGNILRGYRSRQCRYLVMEVRDPAVARSWLHDVAADGHDGLRVTDASHWDEPPGWCFNLGITARGLEALGVPDASRRTFPREFCEGAGRRASKVGDWGDSDPQHWMHHFDGPDRVHLVAMVNRIGLDAGVIERPAAQVASAPGFRVLSTFDAVAFDGDRLDFVHFGYRDNIAQPRFLGLHGPDDRPDDQPLVPVGTVLLGYDTSFTGLRWRVPSPEVLGRNGCFDAFRVLEQDVAAFEDFLDRSADTLLAHERAEVFGTREQARELVAAKMLGRWRNGSPLETWEQAPGPGIDHLPKGEANAFDYDQDDAGARCPIGSHIRRANPRGAHIVQRNAAHVRRLVRRGLPYGPPFDPADPHDGISRGLVGNFLCANLEAQFEAVMYDWVNLGLLDPRITGTNDPLLGQNEPSTSVFRFSHCGVEVELRGLPRFVRTRGSAYLFLPSLPALRWLASW